MWALTIIQTNLKLSLCTNAHVSLWICPRNSKRVLTYAPKTIDPNPNSAPQHKTCELNGAIKFPTHPAIEHLSNASGRSKNQITVSLALQPIVSGCNLVSLSVSPKWKCGGAGPKTNFPGRKNFAWKKNPIWWTSIETAARSFAPESNRKRRLECDAK